MSVGARIKEERARLGISQTAFAGYAGVKKGTQISWEKDASSPTAQALVAYGEAGADVLYILTGRRTFALPLNLAPAVQAQLADIRRDIIEPRRNPGETVDQAEQRAMEWHAHALSHMLQNDTQLLPREITDEIAELLELVTDADRRAEYRAGEYARRRGERQATKREIAMYLNQASYDAGDAIRSMLADIVVDHHVPPKVLVRLVEEVHDETLEQEERSRNTMRPRT